MATSAVAKGLFHDQPWSLDVSGGFASPLVVELIQQADLIVGWGCALNMWTMRQGSLVGADAVVAQVDIEARRAREAPPGRRRGDRRRRRGRLSVGGCHPEASRLPVRRPPRPHRQGGPLARRTLRGPLL